MPSPKVRGDYSQLQQIAKSFGQEAERTRNVLQRLKQSQNTLQSGDWVGKGATAFYAEMNSAVMPAMHRLANALQQAGTTTNRMSQIIRQAEQDASACFRLDGGGSAGSGSGSAEGNNGSTPGGDVGATGGNQGGTGGANQGQGDRNKIFPGLEFVAKKGMEWLAKKLAPELLEGLGKKLATKIGISAFKNFPIVGAVVSIGFNAYKYWGADADGSFDWSRFTIETTKDLVLMGISTMTGGIGGVATAAFDIAFGDKIVDAVDGFFSNTVSSFFPSFGK